MRRLLTVAVLAAVLTVLVVLARAAASWHYVITGASGDLLYVETFDEARDWQTYAGRLDASVTEGQLRIQNGQTDSYAFSVARPYFAGIDLQARMAAVSGPVNNGFGVVYRYRDPENFYAFLISSDGYYSVMRVVQNDQRWLSAWIPSAAIHQGIGVENSLKVSADGDRHQFFVNDQQVELCLPDDPSAESTFVLGECVGGTMKTAVDDTSIREGQIGVVVYTLGEADVVVTFDDVIVRGTEGG